MEGEIEVIRLLDEWRPHSKKFKSLYKLEKAIKQLQGDPEKLERTKPCQELDFSPLKPTSDF